MKLKYLKFKNWLLVSLMSILGMTACKSSKQALSTNDQQDPEPQSQVDKGQRQEVALMYGVPTMNFRIQGKVVNHQGKPVKGIQVVMLNRNFGNTPNNPTDDNPYVEEYMKQYADTTKADGSFDIRANDRPTDYMRVFVRDVDGPSNGN